MNFAAQLFYYTYQCDGTPRKVGFGDSEEYDPFWPRWDTAPRDSADQRPPLYLPVPPAPPAPAPVALPNPYPLLHPTLPPPPPPAPPAPPRAEGLDAPPDPWDNLPHLEPGPLLPDFHSLVSLLLRLVLSFILLLFYSDEERMGANRKDSVPQGGRSHQDGVVGNGCPARRLTLIHPERLKDFGEEEDLNRDVRTWETRVAGRPEPQLRSTPKLAKKRASETKAVPTAPPEYLCFEDISAAAFKIQSGVQKTHCTYSRLSKQYGMEIFLKKEHLHYTGSVKERGVLHLLTCLKQEQQTEGVIVASDNDFSMAVSHHATKLRIPVFVIMPAGSSPARLRMYRDYGAMVISYGSTPHDSKCHARHLGQENNYLYLEEDDSAVYLAGLGTVGMEIYEQVPKLDAVIIPAVGNCGLLAGTAAAIKHLNPNISVIGVEPEDYPLLLQSLKNDYPVKELNSALNRKLYGDLMDPPLGKHAFQLAKKLVDNVISVREEDVLVAMLRFQEYERCTVDMEGAVGLAAIFAGQLPELKGKRVSVIVSSANMELDSVRQCVERALVLDGQVGRFVVEIGDMPADMAKLLEVLAREDVGLLSVCQQRHSDRVSLFKAQVECVVETRDEAQSAQLRTTLSERYPTLRWLER